MSKFLSIFDVRGIQEFIFRSKSIKEIVGASALVEDVVFDCFKTAVKKTIIDSNHVNFDWEKEDTKKGKNPLESNLACEVLYNGGGNLFVIFDTEENFAEVSKLMAKDLYEKAYGICVVSACTEATGDFNIDRKKLMVEVLAKVKAETLPFTPTLSYAITNNDRYNGLPYEEIDSNGAKCSREKALKIAKCNKIMSSNAVSVYGLSNEDENDSNIAVIHIDGNGVGQAIINGMKDYTDYTKAVAKMRIISKELKKVFDTVNELIEKKLTWYNKKLSDDYKHYIKVRKLILAGDDITYICNPKIAFAIVKIFAKHMGDKFNAPPSKKNPLGSLSVCAGVVFCNKSFPFYKAYELAEELCSMSKKYAKSAEAKAINGDKIGSYFDYEYIKAGFGSSVEQYRAYNNANALANGIDLYNRPFALNDKDINKSFAKFEAAFKDISAKSIPRSWLKDLRETHMGTKTDMLAFEKMAESRNIKFSLALLDENNAANYFAPLDLMDIYDDEFYSFHLKNK